MVARSTAAKWQDSQTATQEYRIEPKSHLCSGSPSAYPTPINHLEDGLVAHPLKIIARARLPVVARLQAQDCASARKVNLVLDIL